MPSRAICMPPRASSTIGRRPDLHDVFIATAGVPALLAAEGVQVTVTSACGTEQLPTGLRVLIGRRAA